MKAQVGKSVGAMVGTGILVVGLVVAPSHVDGASAEVRTVQLAAVALPSAPGVNSSAVAIPLELNSATGRLQVNNSALATTPTAISIPPALLQIVGPIILFAPLFAILIIASPVLLPCSGAVLPAGGHLLPVQLAHHPPLAHLPPCSTRAPPARHRSTPSRSVGDNAQATRRRNREIGGARTLSPWRPRH